MNFWRIAGIAFAASLLGACGSSETTGSSSAAITKLPITLQSNSGLLQIEIDGTPSPPAQGEDTFVMAITNSAGDPVTGLTLAVVPWMPAMGHGTSTVPIVSESPPGTYVVSDVDLFMAGVWELRTAISGPMTDHVTPSFDIP